MTKHLLLSFLLVVTPLFGQQPASPDGAGSNALHPSGIAQSPQKPQHPRKDVATIAKEAKGAVVSIVMADKGGQPIAQGSGFVVSRDGRVVTNYHVIKSGSSAVIKLPDGPFSSSMGCLHSTRTVMSLSSRLMGTTFRQSLWGIPTDSKSERRLWRSAVRFRSNRRCQTVLSAESEATKTRQDASFCRSLRRSLMAAAVAPCSIWQEKSLASPVPPLLVERISILQFRSTMRNVCSVATSSSSRFS